ncbi:hypothetical protein NPIL_540961 [Nephila pilipes]|uniref:Uncharacterized protein n=1 Tax=Nephila pilipes TaxID=299642 RepID=A0A8X6PLE4_NEPPI|nr:hypothetical protein NPIL_540961 [Nephila pilipes]
MLRVDKEGQERSDRRHIMLCVCADSQLRPKDRSPPHIPLRRWRTTKSADLGGSGVTRGAGYGNEIDNGFNERWHFCLIAS